MSKRSYLCLLYISLCAIGATFASTTWAGTAYVDGISDQTMASWDAGTATPNYFKEVLSSTWIAGGHIKYARYVVQWNVMDGKHTGDLESFRSWYRAATSLGLTIDVSFANYTSGTAPPSASSFKSQMEALLRDPEFSAIRYIEPWNEPNLNGINKGSVAAEYANEVGKYCHSNGCIEIDGNFSDVLSMAKYESEYVKHLNPSYETSEWGVHVYDALNYKKAGPIEDFINALPKRENHIWFTEDGAYACTHYSKWEPGSEELQTTRARYLVHDLMPDIKPAHVFYYSFLVGNNHMTDWCESAVYESENTALYLPSSEYGAGGDPYAPDSPRPAASFIYSGHGQPWAFTGAPPKKVSDVETPYATLKGSVYPGAFRNAEYYFEYWPAVGGKHETADHKIANYLRTYKERGGSVTVTNYREAVETRLTNLAAGTLYDYRLIAKGKGVAQYEPGSAKIASSEEEPEGESVGAEETFRTQPKPEAATEAALSVSQSSEVLRGHVNPEELDTKYYFEYGHTTSYGAIFSVGDAGNGITTVPIAATLMGLEADAGYHYRIVAESSAGRTNGPDVEFHTTAWDTMYLPNPPESTNVEMYGVSCAAPSACGAVGEYSTATKMSNPVTDWWNGSAWTNSLPSIPGTFWQGSLYGVSCVSTSDCVGVGWYEDDEHAYMWKAAVFRWNGVEWNFEDAASPEGAEQNRSALWGVSCIGSVFCMAAGEVKINENSTATEPFADMWNGTTWHVESMPVPSGADNTQIYSVSCESVTSCIAVGVYGSTQSPYEQPLIDRWNGHGWATMTPAGGLPFGTTSVGLSGVSCAAENQCVAVGEYGLSGAGQYPLAEQWNGSSWSLQTPPAPPETLYSALWSVSCTRGPVCTAVGSYGSESYSDVLAGGIWSFVPVANPPGTKFDKLKGVSCVSPTECVAAGTLVSEVEPTHGSGFADLVGPDAETEAVTEKTAYTAKLEGIVNPLGLQTSYRFEYGATSAYGTKVPVPNESAGTGAIDEREDRTVSGLLPETTYHYRIVAESTTGRVSYGEDLEFTTLPLVPSVATAPTLGTANPVQNEAETISNGSWTFKPQSYTYKWERCDSMGVECAVIEGATQASYTPGEEDVGSRLKANVAATNVAGTTSTSVLSGTVALGIPLNTSRPTLSGYTATPTTELLATPDAWTGKPTYTYQWQLCNKEDAKCSNISGSTAPQLAVSAAQVGDSVRAEVTATNAAGTASMPTLPAEVVEVPSDVALPGLSSITPVEDVALTALSGTWKGYPAPQYTYQWERCNGFGGECAPIEEATEESYVSGEQDLGHTLRVEVTGSNGVGESSAKSEVSGVVVQEAPTVVEVPTVTGESPAIGAQQGASTGQWTDRPASYSYQWFDCASEAGECTAIAGATAATYTPFRSDVGRRLAVQVIATNGIGSSLAAQSAIGGPVGGAPASTTTPSLSSGNAYYRVALSVTSGSWSAYPPPLTATSGSAATLAVGNARTSRARPLRPTRRRWPTWATRCGRWWKQPTRSAAPVRPRRSAVWWRACRRLRGVRIPRLTTGLPMRAPTPSMRA